MHTLRLLALNLALLWALGWTLLGVMAGLGMGWDLLSILLHTALPGVTFLAVTIAAWVWPRAGALLLALTGLAAWLALPSAHTPTGMIAAVAPPLVAALLLAASFFRPRRA